MKNIIQAISSKIKDQRSKIKIILWFFILAYISYFSYFTVLRYKTLYASYYDLGIMNQVVYNSYMAIKTKDPSRLLELTDTDSSMQIKRMAIHNDPLLALLSVFYFIYKGPETLLIIQTVVLALGALAVFKITEFVFAKAKHVDFLALSFSLAYLFYSPMQRANSFDFHAVVLATTFLLFMFYFFLKKRFVLSYLFFVLSLLSKEEVGLTTAFFGVYALFSNTTLLPLNRLKKPKKILQDIMKNHKNLIFSLIVIITSLVWFDLSVSVITPYFRGSHPFALEYYGDFGDSPIRIIIGIFKNPYSIGKYIFRFDTFTYFLYLLGPLGFLSLFSPIQLLISLPELAINLLSNNYNLRNVVFHYTSVIQPFVFISAIYGARALTKFKSFSQNTKYLKTISLGILIISFIFSYFKSPLPYSREADIHPFKYPQIAYKEAEIWAAILRDDNTKVSTTGQLAPYFTMRRYFYIFSSNYIYADYVVLRPTEIYDYPEKHELIPVYNRLQKDTNFKLIYKSHELEVYKKIKAI